MFLSRDESFLSHGKLVLSIDMFKGEWEPFKHHRGTLMKEGFVHFLDFYALNVEGAKSVLSYVGLNVQDNPTLEETIFIK